MTLIRLSCDCGREYVFGVDNGEDVDEEVEEEGAPVDASHLKQADYVEKPEFEIEATPAYEDPDDPFWEEDEADANETRIHESDPIELRPPRRQAPDIPTKRGRGPIGFSTPRKVTKLR